MDEDQCPGTGRSRPGRVEVETTPARSTVRTSPAAHLFKELPLPSIQAVPFAPAWTIHPRRAWRIKGRGPVAPKENPSRSRVPLCWIGSVSRHDERHLSPSSGLGAQVHPPTNALDPLPHDAQAVPVGGMGRPGIEAGTVVRDPDLESLHAFRHRDHYLPGLGVPASVEDSLLH